MASRYDEFLAAGVRLVAIDVDSPGQHAAMFEKLEIPFPYLSDPDRSRAVGPFGVVDDEDPRGLARPAMILVGPDGEEHFRFVSRDYVERHPEDEVLAAARLLDLPPTVPEPMTSGEPQPGKGAMPFEGLWFYLRGARSAVLAFGRRHEHHSESIADDTVAHLVAMDRMLDAVKALTERRRSGAPE